VAFGRSKGIVNARRKTVRRFDELRGLGRDLCPLDPRALPSEKLNFGKEMVKVRRIGYLANRDYNDVANYPDFGAKVGFR
jgi:hypothetical protein